MAQPFLSVIIPAYNEALNFEAGGLDTVYSYLQAQEYSFELLLVDDGSADDTLDRLNRYAKNKQGVRVLAFEHQGKGPTVQKSMLEAVGLNRLYTDFDQSTPIEEVEKLLQKRNEGYDIVIGSREIKGARRQAEPWYRHLMGKGFNFGVQLLTVQGIHDTQCGFKLFSDEATRVLFPKIKITTEPKEDAFTGAFDVELLFLAQKMQFKIAEVPVHWKHVESVRVSPIKDSLRMAWEVLRIRWAELRGKYEV